MKPMTTEQKNQLIADKCPEKFARELIGPYGPGWYYWLDGQFIRCLNGSIIDDLNAMAVVEEVLDDRQQEVYTNLLAGTIDKPHDGYMGYIEMEGDELFTVLTHATSHQRADAFGKVMGLW